MPELSGLQLALIASAIETGAQLSDEQRRAAAAALRHHATMLPATKFAERDAILVECRGRFFADRSDHHAANEIEAQWGRYAASRWHRDKSAATCPPTIVGTARGCFWRMLQIGPHPLSASRIRKILGHSQ